MFYSQFILAKKGPLGTIWIAAHLERKLRKNQVADTDIGVSVDSILSPEVPIALRLSSHLLLGVVRIYNRKVNYLFDDCSEALLKIKQAFRSTAVDLPPEESKAPYHSITLPETFYLDDFELPDSDIFQGNYVDHHISSREQITLQDTMEGINYSTSKFGLDERFGDGDASGLDLDEDLFLDKIGAAGHADESADPQSSFRSVSPLKQDEHPEDIGANAEPRVDGVDEYADLMDYAQAPRTPGLMEEKNLSNVQDASVCDDHLESEDHLLVFGARENTNDVPYEDKQEVDLCSQDETISGAVPQGPPQETVYLSGGLENKELKPQRDSPSGTHLLGEVEAIKLGSEFTNRITKASDVPGQEDSLNEMVKACKTNSLSGSEIHDSCQRPKEIGLEKSALEISGMASAGGQISEGVSAKDLEPLGAEVGGDSSNQQKSCHDGSVLALEKQDGSFLQTLETQAGEETTSVMDLDSPGKETNSDAVVLRPCNSIPEHPDVTKPGCGMSTDVESGTPLETHGREEMSKLGESPCATGNSEQNLKENQVEEHGSGEDILVSTTEAGGQVHYRNSQNRSAENLNDSIQCDLPAPEKLLSVPEGHMDIHRDTLAEASPGDLERLAEGDAGSKSATGRKRSFTESILTEQSLNSVESSRQAHVKRTLGSVPDDDDLLSSILVGRRSSGLKVKPTPPLLEVTSMKHTHSAPRSGALKRKVLMDDTMVLRGDTIRQQLTNTEDIRRVRKKAPCTLPEISLIRKQHMEHEIYLETLFTGMSADLASLSGHVYDLSQIRICQNDASDASLEFMTQPGLSSQGDEHGVFLGTRPKPNITSHTDEHGAPLETVAELNLTSNNEGHHMEADKACGKSSLIEESGKGLNGELFIVRDNEMAEPSMNILPTENSLEQVHYTSVGEQSKPANDAGSNGLQQELLLNVSEEEKSQTHAGPSNLADVAEIKPSDFSGHAIGDMDDASAAPAKKAPVHSVELDYVGIDDGQPIARTEVTQKDVDANGVFETELGARDDILPDGTPKAAVDLVLDANHLEFECNVLSETYNITYEERREVEFSYPAVASVREDGSMKNGERKNNLEAYPPNMVDAEISNFDMHNRDELDCLAAGNDTEFLNVDDDDLTDMADDYIPDADEKRYTENSGWSSRTRAVSKYLQAAFLKEAERGRKSLSLDNLLIGKSRKEASRMFFETLVVKTRDYVHVEQSNPFDDIAIKPRTRLMKSDF